MGHVTNEVTQKEYTTAILLAYVNGEENAFETYQGFYEWRGWADETDVDFILRCTELDFRDALAGGLIYQDLYDTLAYKDTLSAKICDGKNEVELNADDLDVIFGALEDYDDAYNDGALGKTRAKLQKVYFLPGSLSYR